MANYIGCTFGRYRLVTLLGEGGFAQTYLGEHFQLNIRVAVKVLISNDPDHVASFNQEMEILHGLNHLNIVRYMGDGEYRDPQTNSIVKYFIMSLLPNGSLAEKYPLGTQVPLTTVTTLINQLADGLSHVHDEGECVHCDVNPNNILFDQHDRPVLIDFGIAASFSGLPTKVVTLKEAYGTLPYPAPEQYEKSVCPASDLYSLAVIAYELLTGESFIRGQSILTHPALNSAVETVLTNAVSKSPDDRYSVITDFADALEQAGSTPVAKPVVVSQTIPAPVLSVRPQVPPNRTANSISKKAILIGVCALLFLIVGVPMMVSLGSNSSHPVSTTQPVVQSTVATKPPVKKTVVVPTVKPTQKVSTPTPVPTKEPTKVPMPTPTPTKVPTVAPTKVIPTPKPTQKPTPKPVVGSTDGLTIPPDISISGVKLHDIAFAGDPQYGDLSLGGIKEVVFATAVSWSNDGSCIAVLYGEAHRTDNHYPLYVGVVWSLKSKSIITYWSIRYDALVNFDGGVFNSSDPTSPTLVWSPDSTKIAIFGDRFTTVINAVSGKEVVRYKTIGTFKRWSMDSSSLYMVSNDNTHVYEFSTQKTNQKNYSIPASNQDGNRFLDISPDGTEILIDHDGDINIVSLSSGQILRTYQGHHGFWFWEEHASVIGSAQWSPDGEYVYSLGGSAAVHIWKSDTTETVRVQSINTQDTVYGWLSNSSGVLTFYLHTETVVSPNGVVQYTDTDFNNVAIKAGALSPDGVYVIGTGGDATIKTWKL